MASIDPSETLWIIYSFLMCTARSIMIADLVGKLLADLKYSELPSLPPKLASNMMSLPGSASDLGDAAWPSVGHTQFEFILPPPTAAGVAMSGVAMVSVSAWTTWEISELSHKAGHSYPYVRMLGYNSGTSGWKMNWGMVWQRIRESLLASLMFRFTLVMILKALWARSLPPGGGSRLRPFLQQCFDGKLLV